ncbi:MAG: hypothetical protein QM726_24275 [Chitinophagaceae bacterium]
MAKPSLQLIEALRDAAAQLKSGKHYAWGHHGACNCGHLLQVITRLDEKEILTHAHTGAGEWTEIAAESCAVSGAPVSLLLLKLEAAGLTPTDIHNIEYLDNKEVLQYLPGGFRWLKKNVRQDVIDYFEAFALLLEQQLLKTLAASTESFINNALTMQIEESTVQQH